jgi:precorrin-2 dehydrogenase / sirohydrochlorin ferrochelatase
MFPIALDMSRVAVLVVGQGKLLERRLQQLQDAKAQHAVVLSDRLPTGSEIQATTLVMVCGLPIDDARTVAQMARDTGKLVNVEDVVELCDFYFTANVRRGDLLIAVSTGGASPTLARRVRDYIANRFGAEWEGHTNEISEDRKRLKSEGKNMQEVLAASDAFLAEKGWLSCTRCPKEKGVS